MKRLASVQQIFRLPAQSWLPNPEQRMIFLLFSEGSLQYLTVKCVSNAPKSPISLPAKDAVRRPV